MVLSWIRLGITLVWMQGCFVSLLVLGTMLYTLWKRILPLTLPMTLTAVTTPLVLRREVSWTRQRKGSISLICGSMFSGKTRELKRQIDIRRISSSKRRETCLLIKYNKDTRYAANALATHNGMIDPDCWSCDDLLSPETQAQVKNVDFIFIDECFYTNLAEACIRWAYEGKRVVVAALDADANQVVWSEIAKLLPWCISCERLNSVCERCGGAATLSRLKPSEMPIRDGEVRIGGDAIYEALCLHCRQDELYPATTNVNTTATTTMTHSDRQDPCKKQDP